MAPVFVYLCLFSAALGIQAEEPSACSTALDGTCGEGLELLQAAAKKVMPPSKTEASSEEEAAENKSPQADHTWESQMKQQDKEKQKVADKKELEIDFEKDDLEDKEFNRIRFRARHQDWIDILDLYSDGFMQRYHDHDAGVWKVKDNQLILKWLRWGEDSLESTDDGISFNATGKANKAITLKSYWQPAWWKNWFKEVDDLKKNAKLQDVHDEAEALDVRQVIGNHINGKNADLSEQGYAAVATLKDNTQMEKFVRRVAERMNLAITNEGGLEGMVPYYSGEASTQSFGQMVAEMKKNSQSSPRWLWDRSA